MADWPLSGDGQYRKTYGAVIASDTNGTQTTNGTPAGTYGAWVQLTASTDFPAVGFWYGPVTNDALSDYAVDIGIGAASAEKTIVQKLFFNCAGAANVGGSQVYIPIAIPAGSRVSVRISTTLGTVATMTHILTIIGQGFRPSQTLSKCVTYNMPGTVLEGNSTGGIPSVTNYIDPGGTVSATKVFVRISDVASPATTTLQYPVSMALFCFTEFIADATQSSSRFLVDIGIGTSIGSPSDIVLSDIVVQQSATSDRYAVPYFGPVPLSLPAGATVQAGALCNIATVSRRNIGVIMYAFS